MTHIKKLYLSEKDRKLTGLCGGIAQYFSLDSSIIRLAWIVLTILTGVFPGLIGYFLAALIIPEETSATKETNKQ